MTALYRQGRVPGSVYTGRGQEAVAAGAGLALGPDDVVAPLNRELACHFARGATPADVFRNFFGKATSPTFGRDGNMHFGAPARGRLSARLDARRPRAGRRRRRARLQAARRAARGDDVPRRGRASPSATRTRGSTSPAVWQVPAVFVIQSNRYSYSTPVARQMVNTNIPQRIYGGWSIPAERVDGTDAIAVLDDRARRGRAGTRGQRPAGGRGAHGAHARPRRPRRLPLCPGRDARGVRGAVRPCRRPRRAARARRARRAEIDGFARRRRARSRPASPRRSGACARPGRRSRTASTRSRRSRRPRFDGANRCPALTDNRFLPSASSCRD